jgi:putative transcriptional regulator
MPRLPKAGDLSGSLLVAHPMMADPNFRHTILYLSRHSADEGALGFIINRPLGQKAGHLGMSGALEQIAHAPIFEGGPVHRNEIIVASLHWDAATGTCQFAPLEKPAEDFSFADDSREKLRVFLGYAGWSKNQLEQEIALNSWIVLQPHPDLLGPDVDDSTWHSIMNGLGPMYRILADAPDDNTSN